MLTESFYEGQTMGWKLTALVEGWTLYTWTPTLNGDCDHDKACTCAQHQFT